MKKLWIIPLAIMLMVSTVFGRVIWEYLDEVKVGCPLKAMRDVTLLEGRYLIFQDGTKADTVYLYHNGTDLVLIGDAGTSYLKLSGVDFKLKNGALITNPHADTAKITEANLILSGNVYRLVATSDSLFLTKLSIQGLISDTADVVRAEWVRGIGTFGTNVTADTVAGLTGVTLNSQAWITWTAQPDSVITWWAICRAETLIVNVNKTETGGTYNYLIWR